MDSGCLEAGESLDQSYDVSTDLHPQELIWLLDELLNREVAWLMGYPLSQTLFTSVHIESLLWPDPKSLGRSTFAQHAARELPISLKILRAYCHLLVKSCDLVLCMVASQHFYEEEDFATQLFNRELLHRFPSQEILDSVTDVFDHIGPSFTHEHGHAITARLSFRRDVLDMLTQQADGQRPSTAFYQRLLDDLRAQQDTESLGKAIPEAFSTKLQRRLASTVPPRPMVTVSRQEAWKFWQAMLDDCKNVFSVHEAKHSQDLWTAYQRFAYSHPQPSTYPRALLQLFLTRETTVAARLSSRQFLEEDLRSLTLPASQLLSPEFGKLHFGKNDVADCMQDFLFRFEVNFVNLYRTLCLNGCRIRRTFCQAILEWDNLQGQVEELDSVIQQSTREEPTMYLPGSAPTFTFSLSSWVYHHKLNIIRLTIQTGFGLSIYAPDELAGMYWYLASICDVHLSHLERISHFVTGKDTDIKRSEMDRRVKELGIFECGRALDRLYREYAWVKATHLLASTCHLLYVVLQRMEFVAQKGAVYSSNSMRYEIRMKPFLNVSIPEILSHNDFEEEVNLNDIDVGELLDRATQMSAEAKKAWEAIAKTTWNIFPEGVVETGKSILDQKWEEEVKDCLKSSIAAGLCALTLKKGMNNERWKETARREMILPEIGEKGRWHAWWILPVFPAV